jgi:3-oxoacyl-[acyl-carrier-protein] synthase II
MDVESMWAGLLEGKSGIGPITAFDPNRFPCKIAGQVEPFKINQHVPKSHRKAIKLMSRDIKLCILAANEAIADGGLVTKATDEENINIDPERTAINIGAGLICCDLEEIAPAVAESTTDGKFDLKKWGECGLNSMTPIWLLKYLPNMLACHIGIIHDLRGPSNTITCGEAGGYLAIGEAAQVISRGDADIALGGGCEAKVNPIVMLRQMLLKRTTFQSNDNPQDACRPFDVDATGSVFGEGAGVVVLEELEHAKKRGAKIYAELTGFGESTSLNPKYEQLEHSGKGVQIAIEKAMAEAMIEPEELDLVIPNGLGIPVDDLSEATGISNALGEAAEKVPVWATKGMLSATGAGSGGIDVVTAVKAINENRIGPTKNCQKKMPGCRLNISIEATETPVRNALCCGYTFGGQTAALVVTKYEGNA